MHLLIKIALNITKKNFNLTKSMLNGKIARMEAQSLEDYSKRFCLYTYNCEYEECDCCKILEI